MTLQHGLSYMSNDPMTGVLYSLKVTAPLTNSDCDAVPQQSQF